MDFILFVLKLISAGVIYEIRLRNKTSSCSLFFLLNISYIHDLSYKVKNVEKMQGSENV